MRLNTISGPLKTTVLALSLGLVAAVAIIDCSSDDPAAATPAPAASCTVAPTGTTPTPPTDAPSGDTSAPAAVDPIAVNAMKMIDEGRHTFRYDTFGDEAFWGDTLKLHTAIAGSAHGGVGVGVTPKTALAVGLKVDLDALPQAVVDAAKQGKVDLDSVDTTLKLLQLDAVVGVKGIFDASKNLTSIGIQCALCHSTVDDAFAPGIGHRRDGWANRDLNVGAVINLA
ncbi:MAG TPA: hypothetical protein VLT33_33585, partial [Labilithrix sp.]|nr:hypothetical protein [Labilithrix sp.]